MFFVEFGKNLTFFFYKGTRPVPLELFDRTVGNEAVTHIRVKVKFSLALKEDAVTGVCGVHIQSIKRQVHTFGLD